MHSSRPASPGRVTSRSLEKEPVLEFFRTLRRIPASFQFLDDPELVTREQRLQEMASKRDDEQWIVGFMYVGDGASLLCQRICG